MPIVRSQKLLQYPEIVASGSTRGVFAFTKNGETVEGKNRVIIDRRQFCQSIGINSENLVLMDQVHGIKIEKVGFDDRGAGVFDRETHIPKTDGMITDRKGIFLGVLTADCVPLLFYDSVKKVVACAHAGWQGTLNLIGRKMIQKMFAEFDCQAKNIVVYIGPSIGPCCYKVDQDKTRVEKFRERFGEDVVDLKENNIDLRLANKKQLMEASINDGNIEIADICTCCDSRFASHYKEREKRRESRLTVIGLK